MDRFPLLRLPIVALIEVLKCFDPLELLRNSPLSPKLRQLIPLAGTKTFSLEIDFVVLQIKINEKYSILFRNNLIDVAWRPNALLINLSGIADSQAEMIDWVKLMGYYISVSFKCPIKSLKFRDDTSSGQCRFIIEEVIATQDSPLENLIISGDLQNEDLKWILENSHLTGNLHIWMNELRHFPIDLKLNCRQFFIHPAFWVTVDNLVSLTSCVTIVLAETNLTYQDLDVFMEKWKSGLFPNLEHLMVDSDSLKKDGAIFGFSKEQLSAPKGSERHIIVDNKWFGTCTRGVDVRNDDGMEGSIQMSDSVFELFVWKD